MGAMAMQGSNSFTDEKSDSRLYVGNLDLRITEATLIKMFSPYGKVVSEDFLWHTRGPKRGEPRGFAFIQYSSKENHTLDQTKPLISTIKVSMQEAVLAKERMHGRLACGRPLIVRLASEKNPTETPDAPKSAGEAKKTVVSGNSSGNVNRNSKIAAIKNKLKALEEENGGTKKQKRSD